MFLRSLYEGIRMGSSDLSITPKRDYTIGFEFEVGIPEESVQSFDPDIDDYDDTTLGDNFPFEQFMDDWVNKNIMDKDVDVKAQFIEDNGIEPRYGYNKATDDDIMDRQVEFDDALIEKYGEDVVEEMQDLLLDLKEDPDMELDEDQLYTLIDTYSQVKELNQTGEQVQNIVDDILDSDDQKGKIQKQVSSLNNEFLFDESQFNTDEVQVFTDQSRKESIGLDELYDTNDLFTYFNIDADDISQILENNPEYEQDLAVAIEEMTDRETSLDTDAIRTVRNIVSAELGQPVGKESSTSKWSVDEDGTIGVDAEIRSPVLSMDKGIKDMNTILDAIRDTDMFTSEATGLHINIGTWSGDEYNSIDWLKFLIIVDPKRILSQFGRQSNPYTTDRVSDLINFLEINDFRSYSKAVKTINSQVIESSPKNSAVNLSKLKSYGYIELRAPGNSGYETRGDEMTALIRKMVRALELASDPNSFKKSYLKKLYRLSDKTQTQNIKRVPKSIHEYFSYFVGETVNAANPLESLNKIVMRIKNMIAQGEDPLKKMDSVLRVSFAKELVEIFKVHTRSNTVDHSSVESTLTLLKELPQNSRTVVMMTKVLNIINSHA